MFLIVYISVTSLKLKFKLYKKREIPHLLGEAPLPTDGVDNLDGVHTSDLVDPGPISACYETGIIVDRGIGELELERK